MHNTHVVIDADAADAVVDDNALEVQVAGLFSSLSDLIGAVQSFAMACKNVMREFDSAEVQQYAAGLREVGVDDLPELQSEKSHLMLFQGMSSTRSPTSKSVTFPQDDSEKPGYNSEKAESIGD